MLKVAHVAVLYLDGPSKGHHTITLGPRVDGTDSASHIVYHILYYHSSQVQVPKVMQDSRHQ